MCAHALGSRGTHTLPKNQNIGALVCTNDHMASPLPWHTHSHTHKHTQSFAWWTFIRMQSRGIMWFKQSRSWQTRSPAELKINPNTLRDQIISPYVDLSQSSQTHMYTQYMKVRLAQCAARTAQRVCMLRCYSWHMTTAAHVGTIWPKHTFLYSAGAKHCNHVFVILNNPTLTHRACTVPPHALQQDVDSWTEMSRVEKTVVSVALPCVLWCLVFVQFIINTASHDGLHVDDAVASGLY